MSLQLAVSIYRYALEPITLFSWFGINICSLDLVAAFRLCIALRQVRVSLHAKHHQPAPAEERAFLRDVCTTLTIVFGGEAIISTTFKL